MPMKFIIIPCVDFLIIKINDGTKPATFDIRLPSAKKHLLGFFMKEKPASDSKSKFRFILKAALCYIIVAVGLCHLNAFPRPSSILV
jgi:hypothetical protein